MTASPLCAWLISDGQAEAFMTIIQKRASNRAEFKFEDDVLRYSIKDPPGTNSYSVEYESIPTEYSELEERRVWFRNAGWLWIIIGVAQVALHLSRDGRLGFPFWLLIGAGCLAYYYYSGTKFLVFDTTRGRIFIIDDKDKDRVWDEIVRRRQNQLKSRYARLIDASDPERELARFQWLEKMGVISEEERENLVVELRLGIADKMHERRNA